MKRNLIKGMLTACLFYPLLINAQSEIDALRYSQISFGSTARSLSMGGAFGALGADFSSVAFNPAGIGVYRKSEFTFSMGFMNRNTETEFLKNNNYNNRFSFDLPEIGLVIAFPKNNRSNWKQLGFAIGYNRTANYNTETTYAGKNPENSLLDSFIEDIRQNGGAAPSQLANPYYAYGADLAYQTYLLNEDTINENQYTSVIPDGNVYQSNHISSHGGAGEFSLGLGGNYNDKLFFGVTLGFPTLWYEEESVYDEQDKDQEISIVDSLNFRSFRYGEYLHTIGNGFNAKFGVIVKPVEWLRMGAAIHTPTYYYMHDDYSSYMQSSFENGLAYQYNSPVGGYSYNLTTPFKAIGSLAIIFGKAGLISFDYELTNYSMANFDASDYHFSSENKIIDNAYSDFASNLRGGLEIKIEKVSLRAGAAYYSSPIKSTYTTSKSDQHVVALTGGIGFRGKRFFFDVGYGYIMQSESYSPYKLLEEKAPSAIIDRTDNRVVTTFGFRF